MGESFPKYVFSPPKMLKDSRIGDFGGTGRWGCKRKDLPGFFIGAVRPQVSSPLP